MLKSRGTSLSFSNTQLSVPAFASRSALMRILTSVKTSLYSFFPKILIEYLLVTSSSHHGFIRKQGSQNPFFIVSFNVTASEAYFLPLQHWSLLLLLQQVSHSEVVIVIYYMFVAYFSPKMQAPRAQEECLQLFVTASPGPRTMPGGQ